MTTLTIKVDYTLKQLKFLYRDFHGCNKKEKITKSDVANWLGSLAQADIEGMPMNDQDRLENFL